MARSDTSGGGMATATGTDRRLVVAERVIELLRRAGGGLRPRWLRFGNGGFVGRDVFPDGELVTIEDAIGFSRRAGFELLDVQSLRPHYRLTLRAWVERLEASADRAREVVDEEVYRTWRIYMAAARRGFEDGSLDVAQLLLGRPGDDRPADLPLRPWWHE